MMTFVAQPPPKPDQTSPDARRADREIRSYLTMRTQRRRVYPRAALLGLVTGGVAVAFRWCLEAGAGLRHGLVDLSAPWSWLLSIFWGAAGAALAVFLVRHFAPEAVGSGIPHLKAVFYRLRTLNWRRLLPVKFVGGVLAIGGGLALGREGPTIQMGGALGAAFAKVFSSNPGERLALIAAGSGAGLAAAFNAPLAGVVFVLEEVQRGFTPNVFGAALIASVTADVVSRFANGQQPVYDIPFYDTPALGTLFLYPLLGALAGVLSVAFTKGLLLALDGAARLPLKPLVLAAVVGGLVGGVSIFFPNVIGAGGSLIEQTLAGEVVLWAILPLLLVRYLLTLGSYALGAPGGIFAPLLVLGALLGTGLGSVAQIGFPQLSVNPEALAVVGMAALFTGVVRAPLTGVVLIVEMTGNYGQMLPLLLACFTAYAITEGFRVPPIYEALLARELKRASPSDAVPDEEALLLTLTVQPGAPFDGQAVRALGLPNGCILVTLKRALTVTERVVTADTVLEAGDQLTALVSPGASGAVQQLQEGVG